MKIVCDACSAKYSIADEKVQGKVFKIRCKKCSNIIVVRGTGGAEEAAPAAAAAAAPSGGFDQKETRVYDYGGYDGQAPADEAAWHIVVDQEQVGPLTVADVQARFAAGELDGESYIWREGFADWLPLSQVPEFANLVASGSTTAAQPSSGADAVASMFGASNFDDPAAAAPKSDPGDVFAAHAAKQDDDPGSDLFGQKAAAAAPRAARRTGPPPADADAPLFGGEPKSAQPQPVSSMKGQRNENSVLFSLGNLAALASDQPRAAAAPAASSSSTPGAAGHGGGEGSGLIDIRSMASAYLGGAKPGAAATGPKVGSADDLPVFSTASFAEPAVIIPTIGGAKNNNKMLYALLGAVAFIAILAVVLVVVVLNKKDDKPGVSANETDKNKVANVDTDKGSDKGSDKAPDPMAGSAADPTAGSAATPPADGSGSAVRPVDPSERPADPGGTVRPVDPPSRPADPPSKPSSGSSRGSSSKPSSGSSSKPSSGSATKPPADPPPSSGGSCMGEVECMLAPKPPACCAKYGGGRKTGGGSTTSGGSTSSGGGGDVADSLTKADISAGVAKVSSKAQACGAKSSAKGTVKVSVKVAANGTVSSVSVKESPDPALGSCVAAAMQKATFAKTKSGGSFSYPFRF